MKNFVFAVMGIFLMVGIFGCDRVQSPMVPADALLEDNPLTKEAEDALLEDNPLTKEAEDALLEDNPLTFSRWLVIERSHVYESSQLIVAVPNVVGMVKVVGQLADETGAPEVVLLTVENGSVINRDPSWFDAGAVGLKIRRLFLIPEDPAEQYSGLFHDFYWTAPLYSIEDLVSDFMDLPAPQVTGNEESVTGSLDIFFKMSSSVLQFPGLRTRTRINGKEYTQWAISSAGFGVKRNVTFGEHSPGASTVSLSHVLMTEIGDFEVQGEGIDVPYGNIGEPYNFIE